MKHLKIWVIALLAITIPAITSCSGNNDRFAQNHRSSANQSDFDNGDVSIEEAVEEDNSSEDTIQGTWLGEITYDEDEISGALLTLKFSGKDQGPLKMILDITGQYSEDGQVIDMTFRISINGEWNWSGKNIKLLFDTDTADMQLTDVNVRGVKLTSAEKKELNRLFAEEMKEELLDEMADDLQRDMLRDVKISGNTFTCWANGHMATFQRK